MNKSRARTRAAETARLDALHRYAVPDTPPELTFDRITKAVQHVLDVPIVLMTLMDADRQKPGGF